MSGHLLDLGRGDVLAERDRGRRAPHRMHAVLRQPGVLEDVCAFLPVSMRVDRPPLRLTPDQTLALPAFAAAMRPAVLRGTVGGQRGRFGRQLAVSAGVL
jgi:hypothetical protein